MKLLKLMTFGLIFLLFSSVEAQVSVNVQIGSQPAWGPSGYSNVNYYYLPDVQAYYDIRASRFIYFSRGKWYNSSHLPSQYRNYDLYNGYKVVLTNYHGNRPFMYFNDHKTKYYKGYKGKPQKSIGHRDNDHHKSKGKKNRGNGNN